MAVDKLRLDGALNGAADSWSTWLKQSRARRQGTAPTVCAGQLSSVAGVRGRGSSIWGEVQGRYEKAAAALGGCRVCEGREAGDGSSSAGKGGAF